MKSIVPLSFAVLISAVASEKAMAMTVSPLLAGFTESHLTLAACLTLNMTALARPDQPCE